MKKPFPSLLQTFLAEGRSLLFEGDDLPVDPQLKSTPAIDANRLYFNHPQWVRSYFESCHRDAVFRERWLAAVGPWDDRIVVDVGCGPGNLYATLGGRPAVLIGVDVSEEALRLARSIGYIPLVADAAALPLRSGCADLVALNATLHHCDDMAVVLSEAARLVRPGGMLVTDHDPQRSAWHFRGLGLLLWHLRLVLYRLAGRPGHASAVEQCLALDGEVHHRPGRGVSEELFRDVLVPRGFTVAVYPHNQTVGAQVLHDDYGRAEWKYRFAQRLSGIDPDRPEAALSLMCVARRL